MVAHRDLPALIAALGSGHPSAQRRAAAQALGQCGGDAAVEPLLCLLDDADPDLRLEAAKALWWVGDQRAVEPLMRTLTGESADLGELAAQALERIGDRRAVGPLWEALAMSGPHRQRAAAQALGVIGDRRALEALLRAFCSLPRDVRPAAIRALNQIAPNWTSEAETRIATPGFLVALEHADLEVRQAAAQILGLIREPWTIRPLLARFKDAHHRAHANLLDSQIQVADSETLESLIGRYHERLLRYSHAVGAVLRRHGKSQIPAIFHDEELSLGLGVYMDHANEAIQALTAIVKARPGAIPSTALQLLAPMGLLQEFSYCLLGGYDDGSVVVARIDCSSVADLAREELGRRAS